MSAWLNTRQAAAYVGYEPGTGPLAQDPQIRCFYAWCRARGVHQQPGRAVYAQADLDAAISGTTPEAPAPALARMRQLARQDVADRRRRARLRLRTPVLTRQET
jgi:hypothetical protein